MTRFPALTVRRCLTTLTVVVLLSRAASADVISFDTSDWDHGSGPQTGWNDGELTGTTTFGSTTLTISSRIFGTAFTPAAHMTRIDEPYFTGFAFQVRPDSVNNGATLNNYLRLDFEFSDPIYIDSFTLSDVDRTTWLYHDVVAAEGFVNGIGAVGTGVSANYSFANPTNQEEITQFGLNAVRPRSNTGGVHNTPPAEVSFDFSVPVTAFSVYYWNDNTTDDFSPLQVIGITGNEFEVTAAVPEPGAVAMCLAAVSIMLLSHWRSSRANHLKPRVADVLD